jgi:hypothetical protein
MKWMRERDLLIAQTMAFVQSVTGKRPDADKLAAPSIAAVVHASPETSQPVTRTPSFPDIAALLADTSIPVEPSRPAQIALSNMRGDFQSEIRARVANFRAHQERFSREREAYCSATMAKVQASLRDDSGLPRPGR